MSCKIGDKEFLDSPSPHLMALLFSGLATMSKLDTVCLRAAKHNGVNVREWIFDDVVQKFARFVRIFAPNDIQCRMGWLRLVGSL